MDTKFGRHHETGKVSEIISVIPEFIEVREEGKYKGLYTAKEWKKGEEIYQDKGFTFPCEDIEENFTLKTNRGDFILHRDIHTIEGFKGIKQVYGKDSLINHSCDNNMISFLLEVNDNEFIFNNVALRDINVGEEITLNYNDYYYDLKQEAFECNCGSSNCCSTVRGFRYLSKEEKLKRMGSHNSEFLNCLEEEKEDQYKL